MARSDRTSETRSTRLRRRTRDLFTPQQIRPTRATTRRDLHHTATSKTKPAPAASQGRLLPKPACDVAFFTQKDFPAAYRKQILTKKCWNGMCQSKVEYGDGVYPRNALDSAVYIIVATIAPSRRQAYIKSTHTSVVSRPIPPDSCQEVVSFLLVLDHTFITPIPKVPRPVCSPTEWYLDVVCALPGWGCGQKVIQRLFDEARLRQKTAIKLYAVEAAESFWRKIGFVECDNPCGKLLHRSCKRKTYAEDPLQGVRMTLCIRGK